MYLSDDLPTVLRIPLSEPMFILGALFILVVLFLPGGLAGAVERLRRGRGRAGDDDVVDEARDTLESVDDQMTEGAGLR